MWFLRISRSVLFCGLLCVLQMCPVSAKVGDYTHEWAVKVDGGDHEAQAIASDQNFEIVDKVFHDVYVFRHRRLAKRSLRPSVHHHKALHTHPKVSWAQQQKVLRRNKRDYQSLSDLSTGFSGMAMYQPDRHPPTAILNDPQWPQMWYLNRGMGLDMKVQEAWAEGVTGRGVVATILDDGLEKGHPDIIRNYDPEASYDVNNRDHDPAPRYDLIDTNRHGTRCAGEVAADANNTVCAVGVAYEASIGGVRMLDGDVTDAVEARSLALNPQHIDIYSASWGPDDDGKTVDGPGELATRAFIEGINNGRNGLGSIFIWASGNGGRAHDNCNCDGYTNAIWTLSISSATERGNVPWYSEACSSTLATTYSSGSTGERKIITTDLHHECTTSHTGTSASAPLAAGIVALALQVNRNMTWRDMQHIVVRTARPENLDTTDWQTNGVGRRVSHRFGYGLMDAHAMVQLARNWTTVAPQRSCEVQAPHDDKLIPQKSYVTLKLEVSDCPGVQHLEHVQAMVSLSADRRGDLEIYLISPAGTKSTLLAQRPHDDSRAGFHSWPFMTVHMWGEKPLGYWVLEIHNNGHFYTNDKVEMRGFTLVLHGTEVAPGEPSPNSNYQKSPPTISTAGTHISHQDLTHSTTGVREDGVKDSNTQRHNPYDDAGHHSGRAGGDGHEAGYHGQATMGHDDVGHSAATKPTPVSFNALLAQNPSVKKAGVDDHTKETRDPPVPVKVTPPDAGPLPAGCLYADTDTSSCIGLCLLVLATHCCLGAILGNGSNWYCLATGGELIKDQQDCDLQTGASTTRVKETSTARGTANSSSHNDTTTKHCLQNKHINASTDSVMDGAFIKHSFNELYCKWRNYLAVVHSSQIPCSNKEGVLTSLAGAAVPSTPCLPVSARWGRSLARGRKDTIPCSRTETSRSVSAIIPPYFDMATTTHCRRQRVSS